MHGPHQVAQRLISTGLPSSSALVRRLPLGSVKAKSGIRAPRFSMLSVPLKLLGGAEATASPSGCAGGALCLSHPPATSAAARTAKVSEREAGTKGSNAMWGGRFAAGPSAIMREINASIPFDKALWRHDIAASRAHVAMLAARGIVSAEDAAAIDKGLETIAAEYEAD